MLTRRPARNAVACALVVVLGCPEAADAEATLVAGTIDGTLWDIDVLTGAATNPRSTGIDSLAGITLGPDGLLRGLSTFDAAFPNTLFRIDPETGAAEIVGSLGFQLYRVDVETGLVDRIGLMTGLDGRTSGLAFVPGPGGAIALIVVGLRPARRR